MDSTVSKNSYGMSLRRNADGKWLYYDHFGKPLCTPTDSKEDAYRQSLDELRKKYGYMSNVISDTK